MPAPAHPHRTPQPCPICHDWPEYVWHLAAALNHLEEHIDSKFDALNRTLTRKLNTMTEAVSANQAAVNALGEQFTAAVAALGTDIDDVKAKVADLEAQIAAGATPESLDLTPISAGLDVLSAKVADLDAVTPDVPPVEPTP